MIHDEIFSLCYYGGGFTWSDAYNLPIHLRRYYIKKINDVKEAENAAHEAANRGQSPSSNQNMMGPNVKQNPNYNPQHSAPNISKPNVSGRNPR